MTQEGHIQPFDEQAALAELERLRESIQAARRARQRTSDEFDAFVKGFRTPASTPPSERSLPPSPPTPPPPEASESRAESFEGRTELPPPKSSRRYRLDIRAIGILAVIAVIALGLLSTRWRGRVSPAKTANPVSHNTTVPRGAPALPPAASPPAQANAGASTRAVAVELRVLRPVWMRVVVDGRKTAEGTVQAGDPLHFSGDQSIVVRVGNGGDVVVRIGGREESFGDAGQPRTRTFSKTSSRE